MDYFFATNLFGAKIAGPFQTYEAAATAAQAAPKEMRPTGVDKMTFCADENGAPCPECVRITEKQIATTNSSIENLKKVGPKELHQ